MATDVSPRDQDPCDIKVEVQASSPVLETPLAPSKPPTFDMEAMPAFEIEAMPAFEEAVSPAEGATAPHRLEYQAFLAEQESMVESSESLCGADCFPAASHRSDQLPFVYDNQLLMCFLQQQQVLAPSAASSKGDEPFSQLVLSDTTIPPQASPESKPLSSMREEDFVRSEETRELGEITEEEEEVKASQDSKLRVISIDGQQGVKFFHRNAPSMDRQTLHTYKNSTQQQPSLQSILESTGLPFFLTESSGELFEAYSSHSKNYQAALQKLTAKKVQ